MVADHSLPSLLAIRKAAETVPETLAMDYQEKRMVFMRVMDDAGRDNLHMRRYQVLKIRDIKSGKCDEDIVEMLIRTSITEKNGDSHEGTLDIAPEVEKAVREGKLSEDDLKPADLSEYGRLVWQ